jgi:phosphotransferase system enzyme I (PtsI)
VKRAEGEIYLKGAPVSEGIAIGVPIFVSFTDDNEVPEFSISTTEVEEEIVRYRKALSSSREDLKKLQVDLLAEGSSEAMEIIDAHIQMLDDPLMTTHMEKKIREMRKNTESVFHSVITDYSEQFANRPDVFFQQRLADVRDLSKRVLRNLSPDEKDPIDDLPPNSIIFAKELIPSDTASIQASRVSAFVTQSGGGTSHAALIARAKGIPYVASVDLEILHRARGKCIIVDGLTGDIIVNPSLDTIEKYERLKKRLKKQYEQLEKDRDLPSETTDGQLIQIYANINMENDIDLAYYQGAAGIGLFRSEYVFLEDPTFFYEEEKQVKVYRSLVSKARNLSIAIRVIDIGADKCPDFFASYPKEPNPVLGCRGIRFLLRHVDVFKRQLRAILRVSPFGDLKILLPFICDLAELQQALSLLNDVKEELDSKDILYKDVPVGCMLEVPSAILACDALIEKCDFVAIGTNDLIQYTLGIDRSNPATSDFCYPTHPSILRMIKMATVEAAKQNKPLSICGEMASNPLFAPVLIGLGVKNLSCAPRFLPILKRTVRRYSYAEACQLAEDVLRLKTSSEITQYLLSHLHLHLNDD